jgi:hypothetical protein
MMASQPTGIRVLAFTAAPAMGDGAPAEGDASTEDDRDEAGDEIKHFVWGGLVDTPTEDDRDDTDDEVEHFVWGGSDDAPTKDDRDDVDDEVEHFVSSGLEKKNQKNRNSRMHTVVSADTPSANVTTTSHLVARRATFDYLRLAAEQGFMPIVVRTEFHNRGIEHETEFQNRGIENEHALEFNPSKLEVELGLQKS